MNEKIEQAIEKLADQARVCMDAQKAMHWTQAVYNLAQARQLTLISGKKLKGDGVL